MTVDGVRPDLTGADPKTPVTPRPRSRFVPEAERFRCGDASNPVRRPRSRRGDREGLIASSARIS